MKENTCCICRRTFTDYGNNAWPLANGTCCNECNKKVIQARLDMLAGEEEKNCPGEEKSVCSDTKKT